MKGLIKISSVWFMMVLLGYNACGYLIVFELAESINHNAKNKMLTDYDNTRLQILKIADINSIIRKGKHEIIYQGKRYDVKKEFYKEGCRYFYCINDKTEEILYASFSTLLKSNSESQDENHNTHFLLLLKQIIKHYCYFNSFIKIPKFYSVRGIFSSFETLVSDNFFCVITPPPRSISN